MTRTAPRTMVVVDACVVVAALVDTRGVRR